MCGIAGHIDLADGTATISPDAASAMTAQMCDALSHRGPDAYGYWTDPERGITLGHRRLSIIDLSESGSQPMLSANGRYVLVYNGEIYGFQALSADLASEGTRFRGTSDTEVLLAAIETWGLEAALKRINGMFAFALWDRQHQTISFARDRAGKKPLYIARTPGGLAFASELGPLIAHANIDKTINRNAMAMYLRYSAVPAPHTIYRSVSKLPPASVLTICPSRPPENLMEAVASAPDYWAADHVASSGQQNAITNKLTDDQAIARIENVLGSAVSDRLMSDVPLGAFLSGGIDSTCIVALMAERADRTVDTFTIGFHEDGYDEAKHAGAISRTLRTNHHELYLTEKDARDIIPSLADIYSEPFADSSQIPTFLISRFARSHVTVALSGDGGDEVFGGYNRHIYAQRLSAILARWPQTARSTVSGLARAFPPSFWDWILRSAGQPQAGDRVHKLANALAATDADDLYQRFQSIWPNPSKLVPGVESDSILRTHQKMPTLAADMMLGDFLLYMPTDPLHKVDRASMAVSLEVRCPLLDTRVVEAAWTLPEHQKIRNGKGKWVLREMLAKRLPDSLSERPKQGFGVPMGEWLRGPLQDWADALLCPEKLETDGLLNPAPIRAAWARHLSGRENLSGPIWTVLMFQAWRERWQ